jgi:DNA (cytosine-5)-methyltransferase 1
MTGVKPRLLDLFCGAGGAAMGYHRAGFEVVGVDIEPQPNYPFEFVQGDALDPPVFYDEFDAIHASPPCQHDADVTSWRGDRDDHPDLIPPTRALLMEVGLPFVLENVRAAVRRGKFRGDHMLCGTMFGLSLRRHRYFETSWGWFMAPQGCQHRAGDYSFDHGGKQPESVYRDAMGCGWMTVEESREAIPPAYTEHIGHHLLAHPTAQKAA